MLAVLGLHITGGINLCYHRLLNHRGVVCPKTVSAIVSQEVRKCGRAAAPRPNMWYKRLIPEFATHCGDLGVERSAWGRAVAGRRAIGTSVPVRAGIELQPLPQAHQHGQARCRNGRSPNPSSRSPWRRPAARHRKPKGEPRQGRGRREQDHGKRHKSTAPRHGPLWDGAKLAEARMKVTAS